MLGIGSGELFLIGLAVIILFGPDKLPEIGRTIGRVMREFNRTKDIMESQIRAEMVSSEQRDRDEATRRAVEASKDRAAARGEDDEDEDPDADDGAGSAAGFASAVPVAAAPGHADDETDIEEDEEE